MIETSTEIDLMKNAQLKEDFIKINPGKFQSYFMSETDWEYGLSALNCHMKLILRTI